MRISMIGPVSVGKSTVARRLAEEAKLTHHMFDQECWAYFGEIGYDGTMGNELLSRGRYEAYLDYQRDYVGHGLRRFVDSHPEGILDFGGMHTALAQKAVVEDLRACLEGEPVVLLLPSQDPDRSFTILRNRSVARSLANKDVKSRERMANLREQILETSLKGSVLRELATETIYSGPMTLDETVQKVQELIAANY